MRDEGASVTYYACTRCGQYHLAHDTGTPWMDAAPAIDHAYWEEPRPKSPRRICCALPEEEHPV